MTSREKTVKLQRNVTELELALRQKDQRIQLLKRAPCRTATTTAKHNKPRKSQNTKMLHTTIYFGIRSNRDYHPQGVKHADLCDSVYFITGDRNIVLKKREASKEAEPSNKKTAAASQNQCQENHNVQKSCPQNRWWLKRLVTNPQHLPLYLQKST